jgi:hypothetical protein
MSQLPRHHIRSMVGVNSSLTGRSLHFFYHRLLTWTCYPSTKQGHWTSTYARWKSNLKIQVFRDFTPYRLVNLPTFRRTIVSSSSKSSSARRLLDPADYGTTIPRNAGNCSHSAHMLIAAVPCFALSKLGIAGFSISRWNILFTVFLSTIRKYRYAALK